MPNRNVESHFSKVPIMKMPRSKFDMSFLKTLTLEPGYLVPILVQEVLPGDTFKIDTNKLVRMETPIYPIIDNAYLDTFYFFVPNRLVWDKWEQFCGAEDDPWTSPLSSVSLPKYDFGSDPVDKESLVNYMTNFANGNGVDAVINALPFRAYALIWNNYFRSEAYDAAIPVYTGSNDVRADTARTFGYNCYEPSLNWSLSEKGSCCQVNKFHDYFTSILPKTSLVGDVLIPASGWVSLNTDPATLAITSSGYPGFGTLKNDGTGFTLHSTSGDAVKTEVPGADPTYLVTAVKAGSSSNMVYNPGSTLGFENLSITINSLRQAAIMQQWAETCTRSGSRYREYLYAHYGVISPDSRLQIPEYLGGDRLQLNMQDVPQTSQTSTTPLGTLAGKSHTFGSEKSCFKSFTEHGFIIGVCCIRFDNSYSMGFPKWALRDSIFDFYDPIFANIGEQPVKSLEVFADSMTQYRDKDLVYGYQEAWSEYRMNYNQHAGQFSIDTENRTSLVYNPLLPWTYADNRFPGSVFNATILKTDPTTMTRVLAAGNSSIYQFMLQCYFKIIATRPLPVYSIPGLKRL